MKNTPQLKATDWGKPSVSVCKDLLSTDDVTNWGPQWYFELADLTIPPQALKEIQPLKKGKDWLSRYHKQLLVDSLNDSLHLKFPSPAPTLSNNVIAAQYHVAQQQKQWLKENAASYLLKPERWGQALSTDMLTNLKQAGLTKLWLGFDNWMPAFYQPDVVDDAKQAGYLVPLTTLTTLPFL